MSRAIHDLADLIAEFPGIGPRQARRIVQFLISKDQTFREQIADSLKAIGKSISRCAECFRFSEAEKGTLCSLCTQEGRDSGTLMVVEKDVDVDGIEASGAYHGRYFVLGGLIHMARQRKNGSVRVKELVARIGKDAPGEIIFALSTTPEGDYTAREIMRELKEKFPNMKMTLLGRGLSVGAEIEYADHETLRNAFQGRSEKI